MRRRSANHRLSLASPCSRFCSGAEANRPCGMALAGLGLIVFSSPLVILITGSRDAFT